MFEQRVQQFVPQRVLVQVEPVPEQFGRVCHPAYQAVFRVLLPVQVLVQLLLVQQQVFVVQGQRMVVCCPGCRFLSRQEQG